MPTREEIQAARRAAFFGKGPQGGKLTSLATGVNDRGQPSPMNPSGSPNPLSGTGYSLPGDVSGVPTGNWDGMRPSKYNNLAGAPPPNGIADIDEARNWYSPFQPIAPFGPPAVLYPRTFDYQTGTNLQVVPERMQFFAQLQAMSRGWGLLRTVIETRKDQFLRLPWAFQVRGNPNKKDKRIDELNEFFRRPDGKTTFSSWRRRLLEDLFVIDAPSIYVWEAVSGKPLALDVINGATIKPLIDDAGRRPDYPSPAYQQIIKGLPMTNLDERELIYAPMRPTPQDPRFGYSPVEQIYIECMAGLKRQLYQVSFWTEGSMPELIVTVPEGWTPQQTAMFQAHFDALMAGNIQLKSRVRFMPGGMKPFDIRNANGEALKSDIDEWNARLVCFAFSISPQPFVKEMNRATAETAEDSAQEQGLFPLMSWFKDDIMDPIIQERFGYTDIEYVTSPQEEVDAEKQMRVVVGYVKEGVWSRDEGREASGKAAVGGNAAQLAVDTANGPVPVEESMEAARVTAEATPDQLAREAENHERDGENHQLGVKSQEKELKAPPEKKEVGKFAAAPFIKATNDVLPLPRDAEEIVEEQKSLEDSVADVLADIAPWIGVGVASTVAALSLRWFGGRPTKAQIEEAASEVVAELDLSGFDAVIGPTEKALAQVGTQAVERIASEARLAVGDQTAPYFEVVNEDALAYAKERSAEMVGKRWQGGMLVDNPNAEMTITETTRKRIRELVVRALSPPEDKPFDLAEAISKLDDEVTGAPLFSRQRAALIAQAEVGMAQSLGTLQSLKRLEALTGLKMKKRWTTAHDDKVCHSLCEANEAEGAIGLDELFPSGDIAPLAHPRCRCSIVGVFTKIPVSSKQKEPA